MYDSLDENSYKTNTFSIWINFLRKEKKYGVSQNKYYFFLLGSIKKTENINIKDKINKVLDDLQTMYKNKAKNYHFYDLGTINIEEESPKDKLEEINKFATDNNLRDIIYEKQKKYDSSYKCRCSII